MSTDIILHRLAPQKVTAVDKHEVLGRLAAIASGVISERSHITIDVAKHFLTVQVEGGTAELNSEFGIISISNIGERAARLIFELARTEDMVILTEEGIRSIIVVSPDQIPRLPQEWLREHAEIQICDDASTLLMILRTRLEPQEQLRQHMKDSKDHENRRRPAIPGICNSQTVGRFIYVESRGESVMNQQEKVYHYYQHTKTRHPASGIMMAEFWSLETPEGRKFHAYGYGGDLSEWEGVFRDFAAAENRLLGHIEGNLFFVQSNGRRFPLAECQSAKIDSDTE